MIGGYSLYWKFKKILCFIVILLSITSSKIMSHASMGGSYFTQFDYIYETDDMIELTFDQLNQAYGSNFNQKVFGNKIRSNFTSQGNMNYFNNNQNLTVAFTFKTQKPDTICHLTTVGTIFGTKDGNKNWSNLWVGYVPVYNNLIGTDYSYKAYENGSTWTKKTVNGFVPSVDDGGCRVSKKSDYTYFEGATNITSPSQMTGFELWFSTRSSSFGYGWDSDGSKDQYDSSNQYARSGIQLQFDTEYRVIIRKNTTQVKFDIYDTNDNLVGSRTVSYNVTPHTLYSNSYIQLGGASISDLNATTWAYGIQNGYIRDLLITRSYLNDEQLKGFKGFDTRYINTYDFYVHFGSNLSIYRNNFGWSFTKVSHNTSYPSTTSSVLQRRARKQSETINANSTSKLLVTTTSGSVLLQFPVIRNATSSMSGSNQYRININNLKDLEQSDVRLQIKSDTEHIWLGYGTTYSPLALYNSAISRPYNQIQRAYHNSNSVNWSGNYLYDTLPNYNRNGYIIDYTVDHNGNFGLKLPNQYIFNVDEISIGKDGTFKWSGKDYHNTIKDVRTLERSRTKFVCITGSGCTADYGSYEDQVRTEYDFGYNTNIKDFEVGTYKLSHAIKYNSHDERWSNSNEPNSYNKNWVYFGNGKKARISYDSTNGLKLEVAKAESKWIYGLHNNTPTTADRTNQGGFAIISENGLSKLYINGYHYDENKITYNPTLYKTELYKNDGGSWQYYTGWDDKYVDKGFTSTLDLNTLPNGKYRLNHTATIDNESHSFILSQSGINSEWVTIGEDRQDDFGTRIARVYSDSSNNVILEIKDSKGLSKLDSIVENDTAIIVSLHATLTGWNNDDIKNMYSQSHLISQKVSVIGVNGKKVNTFESDSRFDGWGATFSLSKEFIQNLDVGSYYLEPFTKLDSGEGATISFNTSTLKYGANVPSDPIFIGDKKVEFVEGENGRLEIVVEWGIDVTVEKIEAYTKSKDQDGIVDITIGTARDLPLPVDVEIELFYNNTLVNSISKTITDKEKFRLTIPNKYTDKNTVGEVTAHVKLVDVTDSSEKNNTIKTLYYTASEKELVLDVSDQTSKVSYEGVVKTERVLDQEMKEYKEKIEVISPSPLKNKLTYTTFPYDIQINYENELNNALELDKIQTELSKKLVDNYLDYPVNNGNIIFDMELKESADKYHIYQLPTIFYEVRTGLLFNKSDDSRITDTISRSNEWFIPMDIELGSYPITSYLNKVGVHKIDIRINNELEITKDFIATPDTNHTWKDGQLYIREISRDNPFPSQVPSNWENKLDFFE